MSETVVRRWSVEYFDILSEVFAGLMSKSQPGKDSGSNGDITPSLVQSLHYIYLHGPSTIRKIASGLSISVPAVSQLVDRLVQKNLVTREHSTEDRRCARVELTDEGRSAVMEAKAARLGWMREALEKMSEDRREALVDSLEEFVRVALEVTGNFEDACARCGIDHLAFCVVSTARAAATGKPIEEF